MQQAENIRNYYFTHLAELIPEKQFHFATRLSAWDNDQRALSFLTHYKDTYVPKPCTKSALSAILSELINNPPNLPANAAHLRDAYFAAYPWLRGLELALFRVRHWLAVYDVDARPALFDLVPRRKLLEYKEQLLADPEGLRMLSTYAINYIYLLERMLLEHHSPKAIDIAYLLEVGKQYNTDDMLHLQLYIYYYTHCILAETNFYVSPIAPQFMPTYKTMLTMLEETIGRHFDQLSLDTKLEFLVCCHICNYRPSIEQRILSECEQSLSPDGTFIVDVHNAFASRKDKKSFEASEHRNVLYIMACQGQTSQ